MLFVREKDGGCASPAATTASFPQPFSQVQLSGLLNTGKTARRITSCFVPPQLPTSLASALFACASSQPRELCWLIRQKPQQRIQHAATNRCHISKQRDHVQKPRAVLSSLETKTKQNKRRKHPQINNPSFSLSRWE